MRITPDDLTSLDGIKRHVVVTESQATVSRIVNGRTWASCV